MRRGFTILELLVASLLLSMLVTILTMIFNQSSIAWRTGIASVGEMEETRQQIGGYHDVMDDLLPGLGDSSSSVQPENRQLNYRTVSIFRNWGGSGSLQSANPSQNCSGRLFDLCWNGSGLSPFGGSDAMKGGTITSVSQPPALTGTEGYIVGVRSAGPNRRMDDDDDITTYPEDVN